MAKSGAEAAQLDAALKHFIHIAPEPDIPPAVQVTTRHLEAGEQQAIALAFATQTPLVIDEKLGRQAARGLGIAVTGSVGVLLKAKKQGLITAVSPLLESARRSGYWLSDELITLAGRLADE